MNITINRRFPNITKAIHVVIALTFFGCSKEAKLEEHIKKAASYVENSNFEAAEIEISNILKLDPENLEAISNLGIIYFSRGQLKQAYGALHTAKEKGNSSPEVVVKLASIHLVFGETETARDLAYEAIESDPTNREAPMLLADTTRDEESLQATTDRLENVAKNTSNNPAIHAALALLALKSNDKETASEKISLSLKIDPRFAPAYSLKAAIAQLEGDTPSVGDNMAKAAEYAKPRSSQVLQYTDWLNQSQGLKPAINYLNGIEKQVPDYIPVLGKLATLVTENRDFPQAKKLLKQIEVLDSENPQLLLLRTRIQLHEGDYENARSNAAKLVKNYPQAPDANYLLALSQLKLEDKNQAINNLNKAILQNPTQFEAVRILSVLYIERGDSSAAIYELKRFLEDVPNHNGASLMLAETYRTSGASGDALELYEDLSAKNPNNDEIRFLTGLALVQLSKSDEAEEQFEKILLNNPSNVQAVEQLVSLKIRNSNWDTAYQHVQRALDTGENQDQFYIMRAKMEMSEGKGGAGEQSLKLAIEKNPEAIDAYLLLADYQNSNGRINDAIENAQYVLERRPKNLRALLLIATVYDSQKKIQEAAEQYEKILAINPNTGAALNNLAYLYSEHLERKEEAFELAKKARGLFPDDPFTADTLGWILINRKDFVWGTSLLEQSASKIPENSEILYHLGVAYYLQNNKELAKRNLHKAFSIDPLFANADKAKELIKILGIDAGDFSEEEESLLISRSEEGEDTIALLTLAEIQKNRGNDDLALKSLYKVLEIRQDSTDAMIQIAQLELEAGENETALRFAREAYENASNDPKIQSTLAEAAFESGDFDWAYSILSELVRSGRGKENDKHLLPIASFASGNSLDFPEAFNSEEFEKPHPLVEYSEAMELTKPQEMENALEKTTATWPNLAPAHLELALLQSESHSLENALTATLKTARKFYQSNGDLDYAEGVVAYRKGDDKEAVRLLQNSIDKTRKKAEVAAYLGLAMVRLGQIEQGSTWIEKGIALGLTEELQSTAEEALKLN